MSRMERFSSIRQCTCRIAYMNFHSDRRGKFPVCRQALIREWRFHFALVSTRFLFREHPASLSMIEKRPRFASALTHYRSDAA